MQKEEQVSFLAEKNPSGRCRFNRRWFWSFQCGRDITIIIGYPIWRNVYKISRSGMD
mgnify:CR=1 FL=1